MGTSHLDIPRENSILHAIPKYQQPTFLISTALTQHPPEQASKFTNSLFQAQFEGLKHDSPSTWTTPQPSEQLHVTAARPTQSGLEQTQRQSSLSGIPAQEQLFIGGQG